MQGEEAQGNHDQVAPAANLANERDVERQTSRQAGKRRGEIPRNSQQVAGLRDSDPLDAVQVRT